MKEQLDPNKVVCVCKYKGKEVGRVAASAKNAAEYMETLARQYGELEIDYEEDETYAMIDRLIRGTRFC